MKQPTTMSRRGWKRNSSLHLRRSGQLTLFLCCLYLLILSSEATHDSDSVDDFIVEDNPSDLDGNDPDADFEPENNSGNEQDDGASEDDGASKDNDEPANDVVDDPNGNIGAIPQAVQDQIKEKRASEKQKEKLKNWCMEISRWKIAYRFYREKRNELEKDGEGYLSMLVGFSFLLSYLTY